MAKEMLTIYRCKESGDGPLTYDPACYFKAMINPSSCSHTHDVNYQSTVPLGSLPTVGEFSKYCPDTFSFELLLDCSGVVGSPVVPVKHQLIDLGNIVHVFNGKEHSPNKVCVIWGSFVFYGCLTKMDITYTLFTPEGDPVRAKVPIELKGYMTKKEEALRANKSSPDLTHVVEVMAGDSLPLLCQRIYRDASYFPAVARANNLTDFRHLKPGTRLVFPPLR